MKKEPSESLKVELGTKVGTKSPVLTKDKTAVELVKDTLGGKEKNNSLSFFYNMLEKTRRETK